MEIPFVKNDIPYLSTRQMIEADRMMIEDYKIELIQMMENAGRNLAHLARSRFFDGYPTDKQIIVLVGAGGNGGGALVCARYLHNWGARVKIYLTRPEQEFTAVPAHQLTILHRMKIVVYPADEIIHTEKPDLIIDGLIGYGLKNTPHGPTADMIKWANQQSVSILSLDVPSGVDATSGNMFDPAIQATATMTLALPKIGLRAQKMKGRVGELYLADIGVPPELFEEPVFNLKIGSLFASNEILRLW